MSELAGPLAAAVNRLVGALGRRGPLRAGARGALYRGEAKALPGALAGGALSFHRGRVRGALPRVLAEGGDQT